MSPRKKNKRRSCSLNSTDSLEEMANDNLTLINNAAKTIQKESISEEKILDRLENLQNSVAEQFKLILDEIQSIKIQKSKNNERNIENLDENRGSGKNINLRNFLNDRKFAFFLSEKNKEQADIYERNLESETLKFQRNSFPN